jgi:two-component system, NarL family, sensor histidine kinase DevS
VTASAGGDPISGMGFPQVARLELDELLEQLVARARDVQDTQGRLRGLLRAYLTVARAVELEEVLGHILGAARELVNARYAALGVVQRGRLVRFLHTGMDRDTVTRIGALPEGKGVLGRLVDYPEPLRLANIADHVSSVGFPAGHPPMRSFLGVPIRVGDRVFGNLYLTEKQDAAEFTAEDQELAQALAAAAGVAIENATLVAETRRRQTWQAAMVEITTHLLGTTDSAQTLRGLVHQALIAGAADGAGICVAGEDPEQLRMAAAEGSLDGWQEVLIRREGPLTATALARRRATLITDGAADLGTPPGPPRNRAPIEAVVVAPVVDGEEVLAVLLLVRAPGRDPFDPVDVEMIDAYARQVGLALQLAGARRDNERLRWVEDRQHLAEDLHDRVIARLFGLGLSVQALASRSTNETLRTGLSGKVDEIDAIIRDIRTAVFELDRPEPDQPAHPGGARDRP